MISLSKWENKGMWFGCIKISQIVVTNLQKSKNIYFQNQKINDPCNMLRK